MTDKEDETASLEGEEAIEESILDSADEKVEAKADEVKDSSDEDETTEALEAKADEKEPEINEIDLVKNEFAAFKQQADEKDQKIEALQEKIASFSNKYSEDRKKILEGEKQHIIQQQKEAIDDEEWAKLEKRREGIDKEIYSNPVNNKGNKIPVNPIITTWTNNNKWFYEDRVLGSYAQSIDAEFVAKSPYMSIEDRLGKVEAEVKDRFPEKFGIEVKGAPQVNNRRVTAQGGQKVGMSLGNTEPKKSFSELPPEAKKSFIVLCKPNGMTKEQYVQSYYEND